MTAFQRMIEAASRNVTAGEDGTTRKAIKRSPNVETLEAHDAIAAWEEQDNCIDCALFEFAWGEGVPADGQAHERDPSTDRFELIATARGYVSFSRDDGPMGEMRHLHIGKDGGPCGYLYYPDIPMLRWWFDLVERLFTEAFERRFGAQTTTGSVVTPTSAAGR